MSVGLSILITIILILGNGYFSAAELAFVSIRPARMESELKAGNKRAEIAMKIADDADDMLATVQVYITLLGFFASASAATTLSGPFSLWMEGLGMPESISTGVATVIITLIVSYVSIVVGELFPKRLGLADPERVAMWMAPSFRKSQTIARPLVALTAASSDGLGRLFHVKSPDDRGEVSEEEIKYMVADNDELLPDEKRMIHEILDMSESTARDIMTPRADIIFVEDTDTVRQVLERMHGTGYSRMPVFHEDYDRIVGIVHYKDLIPVVLGDEEDAPVADYVSTAQFVPETKDIFPLLSEMQASRQQMVIVVDEYGGTDGLISIEDIVEEIVGEIVDETDLEDKFVTRLTDREWLVQGSMPVDDAIDLGWPLGESDNYETVAGWLIDMADTIPQVGDSYDFNGYRFTVQSMRRRRIQVIRVERLDDDDARASDDEGDDRDD